jgi:hypothetical protein
MILVQFFLPSKYLVFLSKRKIYEYSICMRQICTLRGVKRIQKKENPKEVNKKDYL